MAHGCVIDLIKGRTTPAALHLLGQLLEGSRGSIPAVAMDMWSAYIGTVEQALPESAIVFDRFHLKEQLNKAVNKVGDQQHRHLNAAGKPCPDRHQIPVAAAAAGPLAEGRCGVPQSAYPRPANRHRMGLDGKLRLVLEICLLGRAMKFLWDWVEAARATELTPRVKAADLIDKNDEGIHNYLRHPIYLPVSPLRCGSNAVAEGFNSLIQSLKHAARSLPKFASFRIRVLFFPGKLDLTPPKLPLLIPVAPVFLAHSGSLYAEN